MSLCMGMTTSWRCARNALFWAILNLSKGHAGLKNVVRKNLS